MPPSNAVVESHSKGNRGRNDKKEERAGRNSVTEAKKLLNKEKPQETQLSVPRADDILRSEQRSCQARNRIEDRKSPSMRRSSLDATVVNGSSWNSKLQNSQPSLLSFSSQRLCLEAGVREDVCRCVSRFNFSGCV